MELGSDVLDRMLQAEATSEEVDRVDFIKIKCFYVSEDTIKEVKRELTEWKTVLQIYQIRDFYLYISGTLTTKWYKDNSAKNGQQV